MFKICSKKIAHLLYSLLIGIVAFTISGILAFKTISVVADGLFLVNYILYHIILGGFGGLLLALFLKMRQKIGRMVFAGICASLISIFAAQELFEIIVSFYCKRSIEMHRFSPQSAQN